MKRIPSTVATGMSVLAMMAAHSPSKTAAIIALNDNRAAAGTMRGVVLSIRLELRDGEWHPDRPNDPGLVVRAFAEEGKAATIPGPLIRVPEGTEIQALLRNTLRDTMLVHGLYTRGANPPSNADPLRLAPGASREVRFVASAAGTYYYWASSLAVPLARVKPVDSELSGALVIDPRGTRGAARDRIFVINLWNRDSLEAGFVGRASVIRFTINGKSWPNTERLSYTMGDTVRFRIVNASAGVHPMHLHGFYFNVDSRGDGTRDSVFDRAGPPRSVVTERLAPGRTMTMSWVPDRPGNWMFHCHDNFHVLRNPPLDGSPLPDEHTVHVRNHAEEMMGGLVLGIDVRPKPGTAATPAEPPARRKLRLIARVDSGGTAAEPSYRYVLQDDGRRDPGALPSLPGPTMVLRRGEPVSITVVNNLSEATAVHWHGIELDSYFDGVAGFSGRTGRLSPAIAPRDSFEARFTPPRSGTFIYHPHADEVRQLQAGLSGALLVVDDPATYDAQHEIPLFITVPRLDADGDAVLLNGSLNPEPREIRLGERYRIRVTNIHPYRPSMIARVMNDSTPVTWRALSKDGMDLHPAHSVPRPATVQISNGETYDYELIPRERGDLQVLVTSGVGVRLTSMVLRVR